MRLRPDAHAAAVDLQVPPADRARARRPLRRLAAIVLVVLGTAVPAAAQPASPPADPPIRQADIDRALADVKADPNLATERTIRMLRWSASPDPWQIPGWFAGLFRWLAESTRLLMWAVIAVLLAFVAVYLVRLAQARRLVSAGVGHQAPTHVQDLDIRPESLPEDVGAAARALWDAGRRRAALALLYRGLLSRLAHVHRVPIRDSSTEGDCLALTETHLSSDRRGYAARLVSVWQRGVYGGDLSDTPAVHALCEGFARALDGGSEAGGPTMASQEGL